LVHARKLARASTAPAWVVELALACTAVAREGVAVVAFLAGVEFAVATQPGVDGRHRPIEAVDIQ
jgi:hypothetical protein